MKHRSLAILLLLALLFPLAVHAASPALEPPKPITSAKSPAQMPIVPDDLSPRIHTPLPGVKLTLLVEHPDIVTPTGIAVAKDGSIYTVANHTHHRPETYPGPEHDEILIFDSQGKNRRVFYNRTDSTMQLLLGSDGWLYIAERGRILRVKDSDGDGIADTEETLAALDSITDYPHNGLSGMTWHPSGDLVFALGENFGNDWTLTATDGSHEQGRGEGGIFRCTPDGKNMRRIAKGFWNPFGLLINEYGELFAAENDPGSRPPCRLLHVVEGADYGFQWVYGSAPVHPFVAWNGELRGTLGMVHPSGEGPCAMVELGGGVLIPSWSDHSIDYYPLTRKGASFESDRIPIVEGSEFFRPTSMVKGQDGAYYINDWVFSSYPIHQRGRLWKLEIAPAAATWMKKELEAPNEAARLAEDLRSGKSQKTEDELFELTQSDDPYLVDAALTALARHGKSWTPESLLALPTAKRLTALVALRRNGFAETKWVKALLKDSDPEIRFECLRWIADGVLDEFAPFVEEILTGPKLDFRLFEAALAASNTLQGNPQAGVTNPAVLVDKILNPETPIRVQSYALRLAPATDKALTIAVLRDLLAKKDPLLTTEVVHTLADKRSEDAWAVLAEIVADPERDAALRADAISGLAPSPAPEHAELLCQLAADSESSALVRDEALRNLRGRTLTDAQKSQITEIAKNAPDTKVLTDPILHPETLAANRPAYTDTAAWIALLDKESSPADLENGRRLFFNTRLALCSTCHRSDGRGIVLGPDLSLVGRQGTRDAILHSILDPQAEVAPQFFPSQVKLADGTEFIGILLRSSHVDVFRNLEGKEQSFPETEIKSRTELRTSLMPSGLPANLTTAELRDLLAYLVASGTTGD